MKYQIIFMQNLSFLNSLGLKLFIKEIYIGEFLFIVDVPGWSQLCFPLEKAYIQMSFFF